ncbi:hypothetical protein KIN20_036890 [Parelaphostrongylus tenuis]|uniref:Uncharacterized protein n=1 Tax=Parelaphostrongylus tenuis TaxID=148309 RepID=A0AAD5WM08_PARTN|nr:hypothetical protein KIN20_036890 [Parelaphostrongylus tenuis]
MPISISAIEAHWRSAFFLEIYSVLAKYLCVFPIHGSTWFPFASTPNSAEPIPVPSLSDSIASLSICDEVVQDSFYERVGDRSRSFLGTTESPVPLSPYSSRLLSDPSAAGKLRDRLLRKSLATIRKDSKSRLLRPLSNLRGEAADVRNLLWTQLSEEESVGESIAHECVPSKDDDVVILDDSDIDKSAISTKLDTITIESSSEDEEVWKDVDRISIHSLREPAKPLSKDVKTESVSTKYSKESVADLESRLETLRVSTFWEHCPPHPYVYSSLIALIEGARTRSTSTRCWRSYTPTNWRN